MVRRRIVAGFRGHGIIRSGRVHDRRECGRRVRTSRGAGPRTTRGWVVSAHVHWRNWAWACPMASSSCSSRSSRTMSRLLDCISATYWRATLQRSRASITGMVAIRLSFGRWAGVMARPGLQDTRWTASSRRLATAAQGAYPTPLDRGRVGILGHVLQHGPEMEHSFGMELRNPRFRQR